MAKLDAAKIKKLNDHARQSFTGCRVVITRSIAELDDALRDAIISQVKTYDQFTPQNDPYCEHDFGSFHLDEHHVFWKWDYYVRTIQCSHLIQVIQQSLLAFLRLC